MKVWSFSDSASSRIEDKLKTISLSSWTTIIEQNGVRIANFRMNEKGSNSTGSKFIMIDN